MTRVRQKLNNLDRVREFHEKMGLGINQPFSFELTDLRESLIEEEYWEVGDEFGYINGYLDEHNSTQQPPIDVQARLTKELADLLYVVYGTAVTFNLPLQEVFEEVHRSNMSKLGEDGKPIYREDGKVLKGPNYSPAEVEKFFE